MSNDLDFNELAQELTRLTTDPKEKNNDFLKNFVRMPEKTGSVTIRILPAMPGKKWTEFYQYTRTHKLGKGPQARNVHCPRNLIGGKWIGKCPICEYYSWLYQQVDKGAADAEALKAEAKSIKANERYYYNVIVRNNKLTGQGEKDGPLILSVGKVLHTKIITGIVGNPELNKKRLGMVMDPLKGHDFTIAKSMKPGGEFPEYNESAYDHEVTRLGSDGMIEQWLAARHDIHALRRLIDEEAIKKALRVFKGLEADPRSSFDPSEFMPKTQQTVAAVQQVHAPTGGADEAGADPDDELSLVDDDFVKDLKRQIED